MKKLLILAIAALASISFVSCGSTKSVEASKFKGEEPEMKALKRVIIDYQGAEFGSAVPQWVVSLSEGQYSSSALSKIMPELKDKKTFVTISNGDNLEFVRQWTDLVQVETEVASSMERVAAKAVEAKMSGDGAQEGSETTKKQSMEQALSMYRTSLTSVRFSGLEKAAQYWTLSQKVDEKKQPVGDPYYTYYAVWSMDKKIYDKQLDEAFKNIDETSTEALELKRIVRQKLNEQLGVASNDEAINEEAAVYAANAK
ncbi:MAG: hypothetical protein K5873_01370 [Treponema sp.]|nr:hypothetical protein [Treponema sp.]